MTVCVSVCLWWLTSVIHCPTTVSSHSSSTTYLLVLTLLTNLFVLKFRKEHVGAFESTRSARSLFVLDLWFLLGGFAHGVCCWYVKVVRKRRFWILWSAFWPEVIKDTPQPAVVAEKRRKPRWQDYPDRSSAFFSELWTYHRSRFPVKSKH